MTQKCIKCKIIKPIDGFYNSKLFPNGHEQRCKTCRYAQRPSKHQVAPKDFKWCQNCRSIKPITDFFKNKNRCDGLSGYCKVCQSIHIKPFKKTESYKIQQKQYNKIYKSNKKYKFIRNKRRNLRRKTDPYFKISVNMSRAIYAALKGNKNGLHWEKLVNYKIQDLKKYLESLFLLGMSWENYGSGWHIDHKIPQSWFSYSSYEDISFKTCWSLSNLQPKWAIDNLRKNNKYAD